MVLAFFSFPSYLYLSPDLPASDPEEQGEVFCHPVTIHILALPGVSLLIVGLHLPCGQDSIPGFSHYFCLIRRIGISHQDSILAWTQKSLWLS